MNAASVGIISMPTNGRPTRSVPRGASCVCDSSSSAASISEKMRRQRSRNRAPSAVSVMLRVLRWKRRTPSRSSIRATDLPIADDDTPSCRPATVKLRVSAARTNALSDPRLSIREPPYRTPMSDMFGIMACFSIGRERSSWGRRRHRPLSQHPVGDGGQPFLIKEIIMPSSVVLITGALTGIGRAAAVSFAKAGKRVVVSGRKPDAGEALVRELRSFGAEAEFVQADVRKEDDVRRLVDRTVERFGRLDIAVNNAGTEGKPGPITEQTAESYSATFDTNVLGVLLSMKHEARVMQGQRSGTIINISSTYGHEGAAGAPIYVGSKHAVEGITKSVALELARSGIRVNAVAPGATDTGMLTRFTGTPENKAALTATVPMARLGHSEEIANAVVFIASEGASYITGHVLHVDGGKSH